MMALGLAAFWALLPAAPVDEAPLVLAVGVNRPFEASLPPLTYADDDAVRAAELFGHGPGSTWLLTSMDPDTQDLHEQWRRLARPGTRAQLRSAVAQMARRIQEQQQRTGQAPSVLIWLVGHGAFDAQGRFYLGLEDGPLTAAAVDEDVLKPLAAAHRIHVVVDACHAEALLKTRASIQPGDPAARQDFVRSLFHQRQVGFMLASASHQTTFEWAELRGGVFSALLRSGLRGAANANGDDCVTYSELGGYLSSALQDVRLPDARPRFTLLPPEMEQDAPLACVGWYSRVAQLTVPSTATVVQVEDARGVWMAGGRFEPGYLARLWLMPNAGLTLTGGSTEWPLTVDQDGTGLRVEEATTVAHNQSRGAAERALREGLFGVPFGPGYMRGYRGAMWQEVVRPPPAGPSPSVAAAPTPVAEVARGHRAGWLSVAPMVVALGAGIAFYGGAAWTTYWGLSALFTTRQVPFLKATVFSVAGAAWSAVALLLAVGAFGLGLTLLGTDFLLNSNQPPGATNP